MSDPADQPLPDNGVAGASARREHEKRKANREARTRKAHPRIGGVRLALQDDPSHERAWARGAAGEERVAKYLAKYANNEVVLLHDRRVSGSRANIDHIAIAASGVWVIDAKRYDGKVAISRALFGKAKLTIKGRDGTKLIDGLDKQVGLVRTATAAIAPEVPVHGALCFVDADLPLIGKLSLKGYAILYAKPLAKRINAPGPVSPERVAALAQALAARFPAA